MFADDANLYAVVNTDRDATVVQNDLGSLDNWSEIWQINFNCDKCTNMYWGRDQEFSTYSMRQNEASVIINRVMQQKDLDVIDNPYFEQMVGQIFPTDLQLNKANFFYTEASFFDLDLSCFCSVLCLLCLCARLFICALGSPAGKGLTSWLSIVVSTMSLSLSHWYPGSSVVFDCIDS